MKGGSYTISDKKSIVNFEELPLFEFQTLAAATNNFNESNKLGQGGFGSVYKVIFLQIQLKGVNL